MTRTHTALTAAHWEPDRTEPVRDTTIGDVLRAAADRAPDDLAPGELAIIPGGVPHSASVPADGETVVTLNVWRLRTR